MKFYDLPDKLFSANARANSQGLTALAVWLTLEQILKLYPVVEQAD